MKNLIGPLSKKDINEFKSLRASFRKVLFDNAGADEARVIQFDRHEKLDFFYSHFLIISKHVQEAAISIEQSSRLLKLLKLMDVFGDEAIQEFSENLLFRKLIILLHVHKLNSRCKPLYKALELGHQEILSNLETTLQTGLNILETHQFNFIKWTIAIDKAENAENKYFNGHLRYLILFSEYVRKYVTGNTYEDQELPNEYNEVFDFFQEKLGFSEGFDKIAFLSGLASEFSSSGAIVKDDLWHVEKGLPVSAEVVTIEYKKLKTGDIGLVFFINITNQHNLDLRVQAPLASYMTADHEEIEQDEWLPSLLTGKEGGVLRFGTFKKMGLVFYKFKLEKPQVFDELCFTVLVPELKKQINFLFICNDQDIPSFKLFSSISEPIDEMGVESKVSVLDAGMAQLLQRLESLEAQLTRAGVNPTGATAPRQTIIDSLPDVLAWLKGQTRVSFIDLRQRLLPLDLLPSAFVNEINERALDLTGQAAIEEDGDNLAVIHEVLGEVVASWDHG